MKIRSTIGSKLIAPCGMNCGICLAHLREKNNCPGCRAVVDNQPVTRVKCRIKNCVTFADGGSKYCFQCKNFPCQKLKHLDKRYRTKYYMSMIENLENIRKYGIRTFVRTEKVRWSCPECGGSICVHRAICSKCSAPFHPV